MAESLKRSGSRTWMYVAGAVVVIALAVLLAISVSSGDDGKAPDQLAGVDEVTQLFDGVEQTGLTIGKETAPVTITEFLDMQCPFCAQASSGTVPTLIDKHIKTGTAKLVIQPLGFIGADSERGALAVIAAGEQNKAGQMAELLFRNQGAENGGWLSDAMVTKIATEIGLDVGKLDGAREGDAAKKAFEASKNAASANSVSGTPTFVIRGSKGQYTIRDFSNIAEFDTAIDRVK